MTTAKTLIVGFGNVLLGDDGFGIEVITRLGVSQLPPYIETMDVGIGGIHFVLKLLEGFEKVIVVDAMQRGESPGTLYVFTPSAADLQGHSGESIDPHSAEPARAMRLAAQLGCLPPQVTVVGCEPADCTLGAPLSGAVKRAVDRAAATIRAML